MLRRKLRLFADCGVKNASVWAGDEQTSGVAARVALDFSTGRIGSVLGIAARPKGGLVQHSPAIQMQYKHRRLWRDSVDFFQCRHAPFGELKLAPSPDDANPLARRSALRLLFEH